MENLIYGFLLQTNKKLSRKGAISTIMNKTKLSKLAYMIAFLLIFILWCYEFINNSSFVFSGLITGVFLILLGMMTFKQHKKIGIAIIGVGIFIFIWELVKFLQ